MLLASFRNVIDDSRAFLLGDTPLQNRNERLLLIERQMPRGIEYALE